MTCGDAVARGEGATSTVNPVTVCDRPVRTTRGVPPIRYGDYEIGMYANSLLEEPQT